MRICKIKDCSTKHSALGYCTKHYSRFWRHGHTDSLHREKCTVCDKKHYAKGYCYLHYRKLVWDGKEYKRKLSRGEIYYAGTCKVEGCTKGVYAKEYCRKHHTNWKRNGNPLSSIVQNKGKICKVDGCNKPAKIKLQCEIHYQRWRNHGDYKLHPMKGEANINWKGGIAPYKNHHKMKVNRRILIQKQKGKCGICKKGKAYFTQHKDGDEDNQDIKNLVVACAKCHDTFRVRHNNSKYMRMYGMNLAQLSKIFDVSTGLIYKWHASGELRKKLRR